MLIPVAVAMPAATGVSATIVPTLVPMLNDMKHEARNRPGSSRLSGMNERVAFTVASTQPMALALLAKAPANTNIHSISIMFSPLAPLL